MQRSIYMTIFICTITITSFILQQPVHGITSTGNGSHHGENGIAEIINRYLEIKDALVSDNPELAAVLGQKLHDVLNSVTLKDEEWEDQHRLLLRYSERIADTSNLNIQRIAFKGLTLAMLETLHSVESNEIPLYLQYCSMALNDGAEWLSASEDIANPYYGASMLTCGENVEIVE